MSITVTPSRPDFIAEISGIDLARPLSPADRDAIEAAINRYAVVVFHDQKLLDDQQIDFAGHFGPIHASAQRARHHSIRHRLERNEIADISNLDGDGKVLEVNARRRLDWLANRLWHTHPSFRAGPGPPSIPHSPVPPADGPPTQSPTLRPPYHPFPPPTS